jgi:DNA segregation ATPase FtsK/SpoIIIE, S-DNA-T family
MTQKSNAFKKNTYKKKKEGKSDLEGNELSFGEVKSFLRGGRLQKITGLFLLLFSLFLVLSFSSYLISWKFDDALLDGRIFNWELLTDKEVVVENFMGRLGAITAHWFIKKWFGIASFLFVLVFFAIGFRMLFRVSLVPLGKTMAYSLFFLLWISVFLGFAVPPGSLSILGGVFGYESRVWLTGLLGGFGTALFLLFSLGVFLIIAFDNSLVALAAFFRRLFLAGKSSGKDLAAETASGGTEDAYGISGPGAAEIDGEPGIATEEDIEKALWPAQHGLDESAGNLEGHGKQGDENDWENINQAEPGEQATGNEGPELEIEVANGKISGNNYQSIDEPFGGDNGDDLPDLSHLGEFDPTLDLPRYKIPETSLLDDKGSSTIQVNKQELEANKNRIIDTLNNYAIQIDRIKATVGPTVTLYEIIPAPGVRISKIKNLENDIALSLSALGIRIIAPIPGKGTIGIEVPNSSPEIVSMKSILTSDRFVNSNFELPIGLGKTIANETFIADLTKMPHLLMAGATGQGKSVGLNAVLASILFKKHPAYVKFVLVDPKKVELNLFSKIERHFLAKLPDAEEAIVTETRQVVRTLNSLCIEMDNRYDLLKDAQARNIKEYNAKFVARRLNPKHGHRFLPYIILFIDEFADLIMTSGKEIELPIARLAQLSRAVGLHLIIATQRPSVNIITGTIKANFPARIAFRVTSKIDSRTILDSGGAEQLIGRGDMLLSTGSDLLRLQCAFIDTPEIERITEFIGSQRAYPDAYHLPEFYDEESNGIESLDPSERDELFEEAARVIVATQQGSTSLLQRKLKLGYNRAGRIIDQLEAAGIVGPFEGSKAREVKIRDEATLEQILRREP